MGRCRLKREMAFGEASFAGTTLGDPHTEGGKLMSLPRWAPRLKHASGHETTPLCFFLCDAGSSGRSWGPQWTASPFPLRPRIYLANFPCLSKHHGGILSILFPSSPFFLLTFFATLCSLAFWQSSSGHQHQKSYFLVTVFPDSINPLVSIQGCFSSRKFLSTCLAAAETMFQDSFWQLWHSYSNVRSSARCFMYLVRLLSQCCDMRSRLFFSETLRL